MNLGDIVCSTAGRDAKRCFVVVGIPKEGYALISDGKLRKAEKPKLKKLKHLAFTGKTCLEIKEKLDLGEPVFNGSIREALKLNANKGEE